MNVFLARMRISLEHPPPKTGANLERKKALVGCSSKRLCACTQPPSDRHIARHAHTSAFRSTSGVQTGNGSGGKRSNGSFSPEKANEQCRSCRGAGFVQLQKGRKLEVRGLAATGDVVVRNSPSLLLSSSQLQCAIPTMVSRTN